MIALPESKNIDLNIIKALKERYLDYALATITSRSLPSVRDGLKPVQRRILYAMYTSNNRHDKPHKKSANAVGYVMMHYHPHGDASIYDALVRLAQDFVMRYPLIDGQGNFGSIDGDTAAAFRYTEARLTKLSSEMMSEINHDTVKFTPNYNDQLLEPCVLPAPYPHILINGASGIAVGMATNIPPHNIAEIIDATCLVLKNPDTTLDELCEIIKGPDFPTGANLLATKKQILDMYASGKGNLTLRARYEIEDKKKIAISEIPYAVQKNKIMQQLGELQNSSITNIADESTDKIRIVISVNNSNNVIPTMEYLYKNTNLENKFVVNLNMLDENNVPQVMDLKKILQAFIKHRDEVLVNSINYHLKLWFKRLNIINGLLLIHIHIDQVIKIIRFEDNPEEILISKFKLNLEQVTAIMEMKLKALKKIEYISLKQEKNKIEQNIKKNEKLLDSEKKRISFIIKDLNELKKKYGDDRRTTIIRQTTPSNSYKHVVKQDVVISLSKLGWLKAASTDKSFKYKARDEAYFIVETNNISKILIFTDTGKCYTIEITRLDLNKNSGKNFGEPITKYCNINPKETIIHMASLEHNLDRTSDTCGIKKFVFVSNKAQGQTVNGDDLISYTKAGKQAFLLADGDVCIYAKPITKERLILSASNRKMLIISTNDIPTRKKGSGVILQRCKPSNICDVKQINADEPISWKRGGRNYQVTEQQIWFGKRGQTGYQVPFAFPKDGHLD